MFRSAPKDCVIIEITVFPVDWTSRSMIICVNSPNENINTIDRYSTPAEIISGSLF